MTKLPTNAIDTFIAKPDNTMPVILLYGPNEGLIADRISRLKRAILGASYHPFALEDVLFSTMKDVRDLADQLATLPLGCNKKLLVIREVSGTVSKAHREILTVIPKGFYVILQAGELLPQSSLRQWAEREKKVVAIPSYKEDMQDVHRYIQQMARTHQLQMTQEVQRQLAYYVAGDYGYTQQCFTKLRLYLGERKTLTVEDVRACFQEPGEVTLDQFCTAFAQCHHGNMVRLWDQLMAEGVSIVAILRAVYRYIARLRDLQQLIRVDGKSEEQAMGMIKPPIFFKQKSQTRADLKMWSIDRCHAMLKTLALQESLSKSGKVVHVDLFLRQWLLA